MNRTQIPTKYDLEATNDALDVMGGTSHFSGGLCLRWQDRSNSLLAIRYQGNFKVEEVLLPSGVEFWSINGGPLIQSSDSFYEDARVATLMGRRIISSFAPQALKNEMDERHLANLSADVWRAIRNLVPESMSGAEFLAEYGLLDEPDAIVDSSLTYFIRLATEHPIYENERTNKFVRFLELSHFNPDARSNFLIAAGELMIQSHFSYDHRCNLGNKESDLLVKLARDAGKPTGIYGGKLSGNGDSTTVVLLCDRKQNSDLESAIQSIATQYSTMTGYKPEFFQGNTSAFRR